MKLAALGTALLLAGPAVAAPPPAPPTAPSAPSSAPRAASHDAEAEAARINVKRRVTELHRMLRITPAQEPAWRGFAQVMRDNAVSMDRMLRARRASFDHLSAPDDLQSYADLTAAHAAEMARLVPPFRALYAALSPEQQHTADTIFHRFEQRSGGLGASVR